MSPAESLDRVIQDLRFGARSLRRSPMLTAVVVGTLSIGIALVTTFFSFVNTAFYRPLPYADAARIVQINPYGSPQRVIDEFRRTNKSFERIATFNETNATISGDGSDAASVNVTHVDTAVFPLLKQTPLLGALPTSQQILNDEPIIVIGERLWRNRFGGASDIVGRSMVLDDVTRRIIAVMPVSFTFHERSVAWIPFPDRGRDPTSFINAVGKLRPSATRAAALGEMQLTVRRLKAADSTGMHYVFAYIGVDMVDRGRDRGGIITTLVALVIGAAVCVLLVACTNVATLMLARGARRRGEIVVRASLGASRWQLIRQQLAESLLLAGAAFVIGTLLSIWGIRLVVGLVPTMEYMPQWIQLGVDRRVLAFAAVLSLLTVAIFGLWPARESTRVDLSSALRSDADHASTGKDPTQRAHLPVVLQLMFSVMLFIGAVALAQTFHALSQMDHGYQVDGLTRVRLVTTNRDTSYLGYASLHRSLRDGVAESAPSIQVALVGGFTGFSSDSGRKFYRVGETQPLPDDAVNYLRRWVVSDNYFQVMGIPLLAGRVFAADDAANGSPVAVVSRRAATEIWGNANPIGKQIVAGHGGPTVTVIGVVGDLRVAMSNAQRMSIQNEPAIYFADRQAQFAQRGMSSLVIRSTIEPAAIRSLVARTLASLGRDRPMVTQTLADEERGHALFNSMISEVMATFAIAGLVLSIIGIYGVVAFGVEQRTREMGIRVAMGATPIDIIRTIIGGGAKLIAMGVGFGLVGAAAASRLLSAFVLGSTGAHIISAGVVAVVFALIAMLACYIPARRAARTDPMVALKGS